MRKINQRVLWRRIVMLAAGSALFLGGCDPQLRATIENGIISTSTSLLASVMQALIQLAAEANA